ncbi:MAG: methyltransferase domain-containing protein [Desulfobulbaceae bacterium]|nr:methyltransferase domain-containing protein [Desulfobulbaceae bacterium]HIJ79204.1 methyltransferase domain-containing protein [Deltaproteobacteria bacterium]
MNQWNQLTDIFSCNCSENTIPECAADNICIAWPSIISCIDQAFTGQNRRKALDFGCGGGLFCRKLYELGFTVTGYDQAEELVKAARLNNPEGVTITNSYAMAAENGKYDLITSIMVFQFIADIETTIQKIIPLLQPNGLIIFAVFNPEFIEENSDSEVFSGFNQKQSGYMELKKGVKVEVYNRTEADYRTIFNKFGWQEVFLDYPAFTEEFLARYQMPFATNKPEYLIQAFKNNNL